MLDMDLVNATITELENSETNFTNCERLASLYIIKSHFNNEDNSTPQLSNVDLINSSDSSVRKELFDILPHYNIYCDKKRDYQMNRTGIDIVLQSLQFVCNEIKEFLQTLYSSTDTPEEREIILSMLDNLQFR